MMNFRVAKAALVQILGDEAAGRYEVIGYQSNRQNAANLSGTKRKVQVYYTDGNFGKRGASLNGPTQHDVIFNIILQASSEAEIDKAVLFDPNSTDEQRALALSQVDNSAEIADANFDELFDIVYQIIMNAKNKGFGLKKGTVVNRFIDSFQKNEPIRQEDTEYFLSDGIIRLSCRVEELVSGDESEVLALDVDINNVVNEDLFTKSGVKVPTTNP